MWWPVLAGAVAATAPVAELPRIAATLLIADAYGQPGGQRSDSLGDSTTALLVTLHDLGTIALHDKAQPNTAFGGCFSDKRQDEWETTSAACIGARIKRIGDGSVPVVILVNDTRSRSSAQQMTCIGAGGAIGETRLHLADLFHPRADIRAGVRRHAMECIRGALAGPR